MNSGTTAFCPRSKVDLTENMSLVIKFIQGKQSKAFIFPLIPLVYQDIEIDNFDYFPHLSKKKVLLEIGFEI